MLTLKRIRKGSSHNHQFSGALSASVVMWNKYLKITWRPMVITWNLFKQRSDVQVVVVVLASNILFVKRIFCKSEENDHSNNQFCTKKHPQKKQHFFVQSSSTNMAGKYKFLPCFSETTIEYPLKFTVVCYIKHNMSYTVFLHPVQCSQYQQSWYRNHPSKCRTVLCVAVADGLLSWMHFLGSKKHLIQLQAFQGV